MQWMFREGVKSVKRLERRWDELLRIHACRGNAIEVVTYHAKRAHISYPCEYAELHGDLSHSISRDWRERTPVASRDAQACLPLDSE